VAQAPPQSRLSTVISIATYNIHYGIGIDGRCDLGRVVDAVRGADIIALQEVESHWDRSGNIEQPAIIASLLPQHGAAWGPTVDVLKRADDGAASGAHVRRQFGNMILSRFPILSIRNHLLPRRDLATSLDLQRGALEVVVETPIGLLRVYCIHLCHASEIQRGIQVRHILDLDAHARREGPVICGTHTSEPSWSAEPGPDYMPADALLLGDFNFQPTSEPYAMLVAGEPRPRHDGFVDAWVRWRGEPPPRGDASSGATRYDSFDAKTGRRIDYCFASPELADRIASAEVLADAAGSDHQPLIVTLRTD